jgi:hypothetical protein
MSAGNRNSGRDGPPPVKNSRSNNTACASSHQASHSLVPHRPSEFYSSFYGDYFGDSSTIRHVPIMADLLGGFTQQSFTNGLSMELENVPHSINVRCSYGYGEDCLALESPLPWILLRCIFCHMRGPSKDTLSYTYYMDPT